MCGICGIIGDGPSNNLATIRQMMKRMRHRGPDGEGVWQSHDGKITFGHVRLAIVDASPAGAQPMHHPAGLHSIVNGEIYNYPELRTNLQPRSRFQSNCDSEIVLHAYAAHGRESVSHLNGMFAYALHDERAGTVLLARDRMGIKPLYYAVYGGVLIFASEIKALFAAIPTGEWKVSRQSLCEYMTYQSPLGENTLFSGVYQLQPGHFMEIDLKAGLKCSQRPYWSARPEPDKNLTFGDAVKMFADRFSSSVERHLLSDVGVASYLSAGFDSASVFAEASRAYQSEDSTGLTAYTGRFDRGSAWYDESGPAAELARVLGDEHVMVTIEPDDLLRDLDSIVDALDEPRMGMGAFSQYVVAKRAAENYKVILTGHGGDELFSGYPIYSYARSGLMGLREPSELPHFAYFALSGLLGNLTPEMGRGLPVLWSRSEQARLTGPSVTALEPWRTLDKFTEQAQTATDRILLTYMNAYLPGLLIVEDKISMAHSLESRTPFLDNEMVDLSLSIPESVKLHNGQLKAIVKENARRILPETYFNQPKRGFPTPLRYWLRQDLAGSMLDRLTGSDCHLPNLFDSKEIERVVRNYKQSWRRHFRPLDEIQSHKIWQLLSLESWLRVWSDSHGISLRLE